METNYFAAIKGLLQELQQITIVAMAQTGVKSSSDLSKSVKYVLTKDGIKLLVAEYYPWVSEGHVVKRRAGLRKVPIDALIEWIKKNGIVPRNSKTGRFQTINQMAFAVQTAIYKRGIKGGKKTKGRNYANKVADDVADYTAEELANQLALDIADELIEMFQPVTI
jgi:hypothetical protein